MRSRQGAPSSLAAPLLAAVTAASCCAIQHASRSACSAMRLPSSVLTPSCSASALALGSAECSSDACGDGAAEPSSEVERSVAPGRGAVPLAGVARDASPDGAAERVPEASPEGAAEASPEAGTGPAAAVTGTEAKCISLKSPTRAAALNTARREARMADAAQPPNNASVRASPHRRWRRTEQRGRGTHNVRAAKQRLGSSTPTST